MTTLCPTLQYIGMILVSVTHSRPTANLRPLQVPVLSWFDDMEDGELLNLLPVFEELSGAEDVYARLDQLRGL